MSNPLGSLPSSTPIINLFRWVFPEKQVVVFRPPNPGVPPLFYAASTLRFSRARKRLTFLLSVFCFLTYCILQYDPLVYLQPVAATTLLLLVQELLKIFEYPPFLCFRSLLFYARYSCCFKPSTGDPWLFATPCFAARQIAPFKYPMTFWSDRESQKWLPLRSKANAGSRHLYLLVGRPGAPNPSSH